MLREVLGWIPDVTSAVAFLRTCRTSHQLSQDPAAAALFIIRCPGLKYAATLAAIARCQGGTRAVVQQVLQQLRAGPDSGGPGAAPAPLLQALLTWASACGDTHTMRSLLALPQPPDKDGDGGAALSAALLGGPHLGAMRLLMSRRCRHALLCQAAATPARLPALQMLIQHFSVHDRDRAVAAALHEAARLGNAPAVVFLLPAYAAAGNPTHELLYATTRNGDPDVLQVLLEFHTAGQHELDHALCCAARCGKAATVATLLDQGANADFGPGVPLAAAVTWAVEGFEEDPRSVAVAGGGGDGGGADRLGVVRLLLARGSSVGPGEQWAAQDAGYADLVALLLAAVPPTASGAT